MPKNVKNFIDRKIKIPYKRLFYATFRNFKKGTMKRGADPSWWRKDVNVIEYHPR